MGEIVKQEKSTFIQVFSPGSMNVKLREVTSLSKAVEADSNSIAYYRKQFGEESIKTIIEAHLFSLNKSLNVHEKLNEYQIEEIAIEILTLYYFLSPVEVAYVFKKAKRGDYGRINYALNMPDVLLWFQSYTDDRVRHFMEKRQNEHSRSKSDNEVKDGKLMSSLVGKFSESQLEALKSVKEEIGESASENEKKYQEWKRENNIK